MAFSARRILAPAPAFLVLVALAFAYSLARSTDISAAGAPSDDKTIAHVLDRLGYGARPGDIEQVRRTGVMSYIDRQLHPEKINDSEIGRAHV